MLKLQIDVRDLGGAWLWSGGTWRRGNSWIEPFAHPGLEALLITDGTAWCATVRERRRGAPVVSARPRTVTSAEYSRRLTDIRGWPGDFVTVEGGGEKVQVSAGVQGVAPLYLTSSSGQLLGSWDLTDLRGRFAADRFVEREMARLLALRPRYTHETVFAGVHRLTERAAVTWDGTGLAVQYPSEAEHATARDLRDGADVIAGYEALLDEVLAARPYDPDSMAVELSGGVDSANVAASLTARAPGRLVTSAMLLPGPAGRQQRHRRTEMISTFGGRRDLVVPADALAPLCPYGRRAQDIPVSPYDDAYLEATEALHQVIAEQGGRNVFTGIGGDEMVALTSAEVSHAAVGADRPVMPWLGARTRALAEETDTDIAPASVVNEMTLLACACAAPSILRAGMWPVHPLADPAMIRFGEWLPRTWRADKRLPRERLARLGLSPEVCRPALAENFVEVMHGSLVRYGLAYLNQMLAGGSVLIDDAFVDPDQLALVRDRVANGRPLPRDREVFEVISLDLAIRSLSRRPALIR